MPIFEYKCEECTNKFEVLLKSSASEEKINCPKCGSVKNKKLFSAFSASVQSSSSGGCADGYCTPKAQSSCGCSSGSCGLN